MPHIYVANASQGLSTGLAVVLTQAGPPRPSRNGPVRAMDEPLTITYERPDQRVLFYPEREANPFFHLFECLWMLAGKNTVRELVPFVPAMRNYADDGRILNGAYGHRWRRHYGVDQLTWAIERLRSGIGTEDRRCHIDMWDPRRDTKPSLDIPCNHGIDFRVRSDGRLDMTVYNRSNDLVLGAFGANVVHMSFLHEFVALSTGLPLGRYHQVTNDMHLYLEHPTTAAVEPLAGAWSSLTDRYQGVEDPEHLPRGRVEPFPVSHTPYQQWLEDLDLFLQYGNVVGLRDRFFRRVAGPVVAAHQHYREHKGEARYTGALDILSQCLASDWRAACEEWVQRRFDKWKEKTT